MFLMNPFSPSPHHPQPRKPVPTVFLLPGIPASSLTASHATPSLPLHGKQSELFKDQPQMKPNLLSGISGPARSDRKPQVSPKEKEHSFLMQTSPCQVLSGLHSTPLVGEIVALFLGSLSFSTVESSGVIIIYGKLKLLLIKASLKISKT